MTWPMHDAGPTTPESRPDGRRGRHAAGPAPMAPAEGFMPGGGGPTPAETTMPFTVDWDQVRAAPPTQSQTLPPPAPPTLAPPTLAPPTQPRLTGPRFTPRPAPRRPPTGGPPTGGPAAGGPPGPPRQPRPSAEPSQRRSLIGSSAGMAVGTLISRGTGFLRTLVLVYV